MRLIIWDVDGTLVDSHAIIMDSMNAGIAAANLPPVSYTHLRAHET